MIRPWELDDLQAISVIENQCFSDPWTFNMLKSGYENANFKGFNYIANGEIVGYIGVTHVLDEGNIDLVAVSKDYRNKGIGTLLIEKAHEYLKENGVTAVYLEVRKSNLSAINLYEKCGYKKIGERKNYYITEDAVLYSINL